MYGLIQRQGYRGKSYLQAFMLHENEYGRNLVGEHVGVGGGGEPLPGQRHDVQAAAQLVEETRVP